MTFEGPIPPNYSNREPSEYACPQCGSSNCEEPPNFPGYLQCEDCGFGSMADDFEAGQSDESDGADYVCCPSCECYTEASELADTGGEGFSVCPQCGHVAPDEEFIAGE